MAGALSDKTSARSRKNLSALLRALGSVGQARVAEALGVHEGTVSRMKTAGDFETFARACAVMGLKIVPEGLRCYDPRNIEPLLELARQRMEQLHTVEELQWDEDESATLQDRERGIG